MNRVGGESSAEGADLAASAHSAQIRLFLLGGFRLEVEGRDLSSGLGRKEQALLAYLALHPDRSAGRDVLASLLWGERFDENARQSLRQALTSLRKTLSEAGAAPLFADRRSVGLLPGAVICDAWDFALHEEQGGVEGRRAAAALWRGPLLDGVEMPAAGYREWVEAARRAWVSRAARFLAGAIDGPDAGEHQVLLFVLSDAWSAEAPLDEEAHRLRLRLLARFQGKAAALTCHAEMENRLLRELGTSPSAETQTLAAAIQAESPEIAILPSRRRRWGMTAAALAVAVSLLLAAVGWFGGHGDSPPRFVFFLRPIEAPADPALAGAMRESLATALAFMPVTALAGTEDAGDLILDGDVQRGANGRELALRLTDRRSGELLWAAREPLPGEAEAPALGEALALRMTARLRNLLKERLPPVPPPTPEAEALLREAKAALTHGDTRKKLENALAFYRRALEAQPDQPQALTGIANTLASRLVDRWSDDREADTREAVARAEQALAVDPTMTKAIFTLALVHKAQRDFQRARMQWRLVLELDPRIEAAYGQIAQANIYLGDAAGGLDYALRAIRMAPQGRSVDRSYFYAGMASFLLGDDAAAVTYIGEAIAINPKRPDLFAWRAAALAQLGRVDEARRDIDRLLSGWPDWKVDHHLLQTHDPARMKRLEDGLALAGWSARAPSR